MPKKLNSQVVFKCEPDYMMIEVRSTFWRLRTRPMHVLVVLTEY